VSSDDELPFFGWVVGVVLVWISPRWRTRDKLLATLVWPGGLLAPALVLFGVGASTLLAASSCQSGGIGQSSAGQTQNFPATCTAPLLPPWLAITLAIIAVLVSLAGPIFVAIRLVRHAREPEMIADVGNDVPMPTFSA
jgi:hypothetical protein